MERGERGGEREGNGERRESLSNYGRVLQGEEHAMYHNLLPSISVLLCTLMDDKY